MNITFDQLIAALESADAVIVDGDGLTFPSIYGSENDDGQDIRVIELSWDTDDGRYEHFIREGEIVGDILVSSEGVIALNNGEDIMTVKPLGMALKTELISIEKALADGANEYFVDATYTTSISVFADSFEEAENKLGLLSSQDLNSIASHRILEGYGSLELDEMLDEPESPSAGM